MRTILMLAAVCAALMLLNDSVYSQGCQGGCNLSARQDVNPTPDPTPTILRDVKLQTEKAEGWTAPAKSPFRVASERTDVTETDSQVATLGLFRHESAKDGHDGKDGAVGPRGPAGKDGATVDDVLADPRMQQLTDTLIQLNQTLVNIDVRVTKLEQRPPASFPPQDILVEVIPYQD